MMKSAPMSNTVPMHDLPLGHLSSCQICGARGLRQVLDLGHQAPCDSLLTAAQLDEPERLYPLRLVQCDECGLAQIDYVVAPEILFHPDYPYRSGITPSLVRYLQSTARIIAEGFNCPPGSLAIDIGSNDGTLLKGFLAKGMRVLGVEATKIADIARADGVDTMQAFFSESLARRIIETNGKAAAITSTNMFAHIPNLGDLLRGVTALIEEGGVFVTESHYLLDLIETAQYDSVYHEHLKYYSLRALLKLFAYYDFTVVDAERIPNYGGSIRVFAVKGSGRKQSQRLASLIEAEERAGINGSDAFARFVPLVEASKLELQRLLVALKLAGTPAPGIGCPGRSSTLLNYCNIDPLLMPYIAEQSTSLKLGLYLPGAHIPVVDEKRLFEEQPDYAVMLSWHYADPIIKKLRERGLKSKIIVPLPKLRIVEP
jgi:hypothetical protein